MADAVAFAENAKPSKASARTLLRRQQRKHTKASYQALKAKLLALVQPLPSASTCGELEYFREYLYSSAGQLVQCSWCGVSFPLAHIGLQSCAGEPNNGSVLFAPSLRSCGDVNGDRELFAPADVQSSEEGPSIGSVQPDSTASAAVEQQQEEASPAESEDLKLPSLPVQEFASEAGVAPDPCVVVAEEPLAGTDATDTARSSVVLDARTVPAVSLESLASTSEQMQELVTEAQSADVFASLQLGGLKCCSPLCQ